MSGSTSLEDSPASPVFRSMLEQIRSNHEEIERLEQLVMKDLKTEHPSPMKQLLQGHRLRSMTNSIILKTEKLVETYENKVGAIKDERAPLGENTETWTNVSSAFFHRLQDIREYHEKHPSGRLVDADEEDYEALLKEEPVIAFSVEEGFGRYLDLHDMYNQYINSDFGERVEYSAYLDVFSQPEKIPLKLKLSRQYTKYMEALLEYLIYFFKRTEPLQDLDRILNKVETDFEERYAGQENELIPSHFAVMDLDYYTTVEELIDMESEKLIEALGALGLTTGGTLQQRAERLFLTKQAGLEKKQSLTEAKVKKLCNLLDETIERTKQNRAKKQALAFEDMEKEEAHTESESGGDDCNNPLNRTMGWDNKPVPYWLHKLGLGQEYKCEICGNKSYGGKRAFERHFIEWPHQFGLRRLGIPSTEEFNGITSIEEANELSWERMPKRQRLVLPRPVLARSQLTDHEIKEKSSNQVPAGVAIPPPDITSVVKRTARILSIKGLEFERMIIDIFGNDAIFKFLKSSDPYHAFFQHKLAKYRAQNQEDGARAITRIQSVSGVTYSQTYLPAEFKVPPPRLETRKFTCRLPDEGIAPEELDVIKLTAQFWARYGKCFWDGGVREKVITDPLFEFMKPADGRFTIFERLVHAYSGVLRRHEILKEELRKNAADVETVLENCFHCLQWDRSFQERWEKARDKKRPKMGGIDEAFGQLLVMREMALRPAKPEPNRQKIDESELVPEDQFLAQQPPGCATIWVSIPEAMDAYVEIIVHSLSETVASLKEKIDQAVDVPVSKQKISGKTGLLKDNKSLAYYNVGAGEMLTLSLGWMRRNAL